MASSIRTTGDHDYKPLEVSSLDAKTIEGVVTAQIGGTMLAKLIVTDLTAGSIIVETAEIDMDSYYSTKVTITANGTHEITITEADNYLRIKGDGSLAGDNLVANVILKKKIVNSLSTLSYKGVWDASTDTPTLPTPTEDNLGYWYMCDVGGVYGAVTYNKGDAITSNGSAWEKLDEDIWGIDGFLPLTAGSGKALTGALHGTSLNMSGAITTNSTVAHADAVLANQSATLGQVETLAGGHLPLEGGALTGDLDMAANDIKDVDTINPDGETATFGGALVSQNTSIGQWGDNGGFARVGHSNFQDSADSYGILQQDSGSMYVSSAPNTTIRVCVGNSGGTGFEVNNAATVFKKPITVDGTVSGTPAALPTEFVTLGQAETLVGGASLPLTAGSSKPLTDTLYGTDLEMAGGATFGDTVSGPDALLPTEFVTLGQAETLTGGASLPLTAGSGKALTGPLYGTSINMTSGATFGDTVSGSNATLPTEFVTLEQAETLTGESSLPLTAGSGKALTGSLYGIDLNMSGDATVGGDIIVDTIKGKTEGNTVGIGSTAGILAFNATNSVSGARLQCVDDVADTLFRFQDYTGSTKVTIHKTGGATFDGTVSGSDALLSTEFVTLGQTDGLLPLTAGSGKALTDALHGTDLSMSSGGNVAEAGGQVGLSANSTSATPMCRIKGALRGNSTGQDRGHMDFYTVKYSDGTENKVLRLTDEAKAEFYGGASFAGDLSVIGSDATLTIRNDIGADVGDTKLYLLEGIGDYGCYFNYNAVNNLFSFGKRFASTDSDLITIARDSGYLNSVSGATFGDDVTISGNLYNQKSVRVEEYYNSTLAAPRYYKLAKLNLPESAGNGDVHISGTLGNHAETHSNINVSISSRNGWKINGTLFGKNANGCDILIATDGNIYLRGYSYFLANIVVSITGSQAQLLYDGTYTTTAPTGLCGLTNATEVGTYWVGSTTKQSF